MRFQSENAVVKFLQRRVDGTLQSFEVLYGCVANYLTIIL